MSGYPTVEDDCEEFGHDWESETALDSLGEPITRQYCYFCEIERDEVDI